MKLLTELFAVLSIDATATSPTEPSIASLLAFQPNRNDNRRLTPIHLLTSRLTSGWVHPARLDLDNPHTYTGVDWFPRKIPLIPFGSALVLFVEGVSVKFSLVPRVRLPNRLNLTATVQPAQFD